MTKRRFEEKLGVLSKRQTLAIQYTSTAFGLSGKDVLKAIKEYADKNGIPLNKE